MAELILSTTDGSIPSTTVVSGLLAADDGNVTINPLTLSGTQIIPGIVPIFSTSNVPIFSTSGIPLHAAKIIKKKESDLDGYIFIGETNIIIDWSASGRPDLDCLAYWSDNSGYSIGWRPVGNGNGSLGDKNYRMYWYSDNTALGPEHITLITTPGLRCPAEQSPYQYKIHLNFYATGSGPSTAKVTVNFGDTSIFKVITPSTNEHQPATTSDPFVTITFAADGTPTSIT